MSAERFRARIFVAPKLGIASPQVEGMPSYRKFGHYECLARLYVRLAGKRWRFTGAQNSLARRG